MLTRLVSRNTKALSKLTQTQLLTKRLFADEAGSLERDGIKAKQLPQPPEGDIPEFFSFTLSCPHKELFTEAPV